MSKWHKEWNYRYALKKCCFSCKHITEEPLDLKNPVVFGYIGKADFCKRVKPRRFVDIDWVCDYWEGE